MIEKEKVSEMQDLPENAINVLVPVIAGGKNYKTPFKLKPSTVIQPAEEFNASTPVNNSYIEISDNGTITLNTALFARMQKNSLCNILCAGQVLISGAIAPESSYTAITGGFREISILIDVNGAAKITVYEKILKMV